MTNTETDNALPEVKPKRKKRKRKAAKLESYRSIWDIKKCVNVKQHMMYERWATARKRNALCDKWADSFRNYLKDVIPSFPDKDKVVDGPEGKAILKQWKLWAKAKGRTRSPIIGPENFAWVKVKGPQVRSKKYKLRSNTAFLSIRELDLAAQRSNVTSSKFYARAKQFGLGVSEKELSIGKIGNYHSSYVMFRNTILAIEAWTKISGATVSLLNQHLEDNTKRLNRKSIEVIMKNISTKNEKWMKAIEVDDGYNYALEILVKREHQNFEKQFREGTRKYNRPHRSIPGKTKIRDMAFQRLYFDDPETGVMRCLAGDAAKLVQGVDYLKIGTQKEVLPHYL